MIESILSTSLRVLMRFTLPFGPFPTPHTTEVHEHYGLFSLSHCFVVLLNEPAFTMRTSLVHTSLLLFKNRLQQSIALKRDKTIVSCPLGRDVGT